MQQFDYPGHNFFTTDLICIISLWPGESNCDLIFELYFRGRPCIMGEGPKNGVWHTT